MSDSVRRHRLQPTRLPRLWDSAGKNTGVGCHFLLQCMKVKSESEVAQSCPTLSHPMDCSLPGSSTHEIFQARVLEIRRHLSQQKDKVRARIIGRYLWQGDLENWMVAASFFTRRRQWHPTIKTRWISKPEARVWARGGQNTSQAYIIPCSFTAVFLLSEKVKK